MIDWYAAFGIPSALMSDGPAHFKSEAIRLVSKFLTAPHHFTVRCCLWSNTANVAVERRGKEIFRTFYVISSKLQLRPEM